MEISSGYFSWAYDGSIGGPIAYYDTYRHAKDVIVTYGNGYEQRATLGDSPSNDQIIPLENIATSSIKLTFINSYAGVGNGNYTFGLGLVKFNNTTKITDQPTNGNGATQGLTIDTGTWQNYLPWIVGGIFLAIVIVAACIALRNSRGSHPKVITTKMSQHNKVNKTKKQTKP